MKPHLNRGLFSNYYLEELLPREQEFKISLSELERGLEAIRSIWDKTHLSSLNEPQLRKHFLDKVFEILGWMVDVEPPTPSGEWAKHPDYALFHSPEDLKIAQKATKEDYFKSTICLGEAKRWGRPLDKKIKVDPEDPQNPSLQISRYLWLTEVKWGILTDGRHWRLYERETSKRLDIFYEIDLVALIENGSIENFKYFYLFFRSHAFPAFLEKVYKESVDYAEAVGEELKENVYQALKTLSQGFLKTPENNLIESHLKEIHDNSLILLYRLLFILYAEYRGLLPLGENLLYTDSYSLDTFKKEIADKLDRHEPIPTSTHGYWNKLKELFEIINNGNSELGVPPYNGGLFDPAKYGFLERYRVGDLYIAKAKDLLSRSSDRAYIDYGSLEIRHLGSIYEGLLEYKLKIADNNLVPVKEKGKEVFISLKEAKEAKKKIKEEEIVRKGEIYLVTDKGERKATGSYYTPDYIVNYIIENTLGPLVDRIYKEAKWVKEIKNSNPHFNEIFEEIIEEKGGEEKENLLSLWKLTRDSQERRNFLLNLLDGAEPSHKYDPLERILQLKILDPAMGSGHFLVEATNFLARELLKVLSGEPLLGASREMMVREAKEPYGIKEQEEDVRWARREVVERCMFGVDLNPLAVELAKLSLWLYTVAKDRPLNFLDHHLRCGNSLIGAKIDDLVRLPALKKKKAEKEFKQIGIFENAFREKVGILLKSFELIEALPSDTVEQIRKKETYYQDFRRALSRFQDVADVWTSRHFGNEIDFWSYQRLHDELRGVDEEWDGLSQEPWFRKARVVATEKKFFHWELEYPEVFFESNQRKQNPGFDTVIGNPPWGSEFNLIEREYLKTLYSKIIVRMVDSYMYFVRQALSLSKINGFVGQIIPNPFLTQVDMKKLRKYLIDSTKITHLLNLGDGVFTQELANPSSVFVSKKTNSGKMLAVHEVLVCDIRELRPHEKENAVTAGRLFYHQVQQYFYQRTHNYSLITKGFQATELVRKLQESALSLNDFLEEEIQRGISADYSKAFIVNKRTIQEKKLERDICNPVITGHNVSRFRLEYDNEYIIYLTRNDNIKHYPNAEKHLEGFKGKITCREVMGGKHPWFALHRPRDPSIFRGVKLVGLTTSDRLNLSLDSGELFAMDNLYLIHLRSHHVRTYYWILAILNSCLLSYIYRSLAQEEDRVLPQVKAENLYALPICRVSFVTPNEERSTLLDEGKKRYEKYIETGDPNTLIYFIESRLMKKHQPDAELVEKHNAEPSHKTWQIPKGSLCDQSDVVQDILAFLAEQMINMNKDKEKENRGFFEWLESQLKILPDEKGNTGTEALTGKSQIKDYLGDYQKRQEHLSFEGFWKILEKNKNRIQTNLRSREIFDIIKAEYLQSLSRLLPIKEKLRKTDGLIDQIVYKLYGLTEEEIKLVENRS